MIICRQKKKSISILLLCAFCTTVLLGCGSRAVETQNDNTADTTETSASKAVVENVALTEQELARWTDYVNSRENNAFLLSYYDEPKQIDLNELFYTGCGLDMEELTDKEVQEYLEWAEMDEVYTDFTRITGEQVASVLKQRLGLTMEDMEQPLEWCYLTNSDAYVMQHGDTNAQNFNCIAGTRTGNQVVLDCLSEMTGEICRVTLELPENSEIWMFVSNEAVMNDLAGADNGESTIYGENFEDSIFISDEAYMEVYARLGEENAQQLRVFAENFERWLPKEGAMAGGTLGIAVYDLDKDGQLELMCTLVQGTGLYACNAFYHADVENGQVFELGQEASPTGLAFEIEQTPSSAGWANAYQDEQGRILYMSSDYEKAGLQSVFCTEGYYYLENEEVVSVAIRSHMLEYNENEEEIYTYYLSDWDTSVEKEEWENAVSTFQTGKKALDASVCWKDLYETEISEKKVLGWFLLLAESLDGRSDNETMEAMVAEEESTSEIVVEEELPIPYDFILNNIYDALQLNPVTDEINCVHFSTGIYEAVVSCDEVDDRMKAIACCVMDVNEDGVEELLIVDTVWTEPGNVRILDMYTLVEGTPVKVIEGWARNRYYLLDDGKIYSSGSGGAAYSNEELLEFAPGATALTSKELYFTYPKDNDMYSVGYYYSGDGIYDVSAATEISEDEFRSFINDCESRMVMFEAKTFDLFNLR